MNGQEPLKFCAQCPSSIMCKEPYSSTTIDVCGVCYGVWLDDGELQQIVSEYGTKFRLDESTVQSARQFLSSKENASDVVPEAENERAKALLCPICHGICFPTMYGFESGIIINRCAQGHGVFLDPTELEAILVYSSRLLRGHENISMKLPALASPGHHARPPSARYTAPKAQSGRMTAPPPSEPFPARPPTDRYPPPLGSSLFRAPSGQPFGNQAPAIESENRAQSKPRMRTTRHLPQPHPIDVRMTVSREGGVFFDAIRSPEGVWYPVKKGGTVDLPQYSQKTPHFWVELENGGALVIRQYGMKFEWLLVGAGEGPTSGPYSIKQFKKS